MIADAKAFWIALNDVKYLPLAEDDGTLLIGEVSFPPL